jgi:hypothetical protein
MTTAQLVSLDEYLHTSYEHDAEYVEGRIVYRAVPQKPHSKKRGFPAQGVRARDCGRVF